MSAGNTARPQEHLLSLQPVTTITHRDIPVADCKFVADPFIHYDRTHRLWVLFVEVARPARRQYIGVLASPDLASWHYQGEAVMGSRESFPGIYEHHGAYLLIPCVSVSQSPGLVPIYRATSLLGPWRLAAEFRLNKRVNDRVLIPTGSPDRFHFVYGTEGRAGPALEYLQLTLDPKGGIANLGPCRVLARTSKLALWLARQRGQPAITQRPAGRPIIGRKGLYLPLQASVAGEYGSRVALAHIAVDADRLVLDSIDHLEPGCLSAHWTKSHHLCFFEDSGGMTVVAADGCRPGEGWEVGIYASRAVLGRQPQNQSNGVSSGAQGENAEGLAATTR